MKLVDYEGRIERLVCCGRPFDEVEDIIDAAALSDDEKAALWLWAWSFMDAGVQRRIARETLAATS